MTELENREAHVLAAARRGLSSSDADRERVRVKIASALASGELSDDEEPELDASRSSALFKAGLGLGLAVLAVGGGYAAGHRAGFASGVREGAATVSPAIPSAASQREVVVPYEEAVPVPATLPVASASPSSSVARRAVPSTSAAVSGGTPAIAESDIDEELRTLRRVERAQRSGNPRLALALLDELDRDRPRGQLMEERAAARAVAECQSGFGAARSEIAAQFRKQYGSSVYLTRVEAACTETDSSSSGDSPLERESPQ